MINATAVKALVLLAAFAAGAVVNGWRVKAHYQSEIAAIESDRQSERDEAARKTRIITDQYTEALNNARKRETDLRLSVDGSRNELDRLRVTIKTRSAAVAASPASAVDYSLAVSELFAECAGEYQALAGKADGHVTDLTTMIQAWPVSPR